MKTSIFAKGLSLVGLLLLSVSLSFGQGALATVTGTISDSTGAVIANAPVSLKNLDTGAVYTASSSATGNYTVSQLSIGDYSLTVTSTGFKTYSRAKFHLSAEQTLQEDVKLEIGATGEVVTVTADASMLQTESSELSHNITLSQMNNLPILNIGVSNQGFRDPLSAVRLLAGVRYLQTATANTMIVNGTASNSVQLRLDGQTQGALSPSLAGAIGQHQPSVDAIEEVAIQTSNFAAEYGTAGGAVINMVSKSGTNQYHGTVYDYMRNEALDAHQPYTGLRNKVRQNDWGFTFGGPVRIPKLYNGTNKTFFFWNYEQYRNNQILVNQTATVPTPAYRAGDFSNLLLQSNQLVTVAAPAGGCAAGTAAVTAGSCNYIDPLGRTIASGQIFNPLDTTVAANGTLVRNPFVGNKIPLTSFDPTAVKILALVPQPLGVNAAKGQAGNNYQLPAQLTRISQIPSLKVDQNLGTKNKVSFYWSSTKTNTPRSPTGIDNLPDTITGSSTSNSVARSARINWDQTVTPRLLLHYGIGWNDIDFRLSSPVIDYDAMAQLGLRQSVVRNFPRISAAPIFGINPALGGLSALGPATQTITMERRPAVNVTGTYVLGRHTFKGGAEFRLEKYPNYNLSNTNGTYGFATTYTGQSALQGVTTNAGTTGFELASFMLGGYNSLTMAAPIQASTSKSQTSMYLQDNWKATRKLTVDYGVRWDYGTYAKEQYGRYSVFNANIADPAASGRGGAREFESVCKCQFASNYPYAIGPRLGAAYQINRKTVIRAGLGVVYGATGTNAGGPVNTAFSPTVAAYQVIGNLKDGTPASVNPVWPNFDPAAGFITGSVNPMPFGLDPNAGRPSRQLQWNVTVQREINRNLVVEVAYVANRVVWTEADGLVNLNNMNVPTLNTYGFKDFTSATDSAMLTATMAALTPAQKATLAARGVNLPYPNFPTTQTLRQSLLPFPQYTGQTVTGAPLGKTWYDSMQMTVNKRFSHGLSGTFNYTYSKSLDWNTSPDPYNRPLGKNLGVFDQPNQIRLTLQYVIPDTRKTGLPVLSNRWVNQAVSGWGLGWYGAYQSAGLAGLPSSLGSVPISNFLGYGPGSAQIKLDANGQPMNPWSVDWTDYSGVHHTDPININCHCFDPTKTQVLNPAAWTNVPAGVFAASQSSIRGFRGIRIPTESANMSRNFRFGHDGRYNLNVRVEFQNIFNRMQLPGPQLGNFATPVTKFATGLFTGLNNTGFGVINPTAGTAGQRLGTFVGRLTF